MFDLMTPDERLALARQHAADVRRDRLESGRRPAPRPRTGHRLARPVGLALVQVGLWLGGAEAVARTARGPSGC